MTYKTKELGQNGENLATNFLIKNNYQIIKRNYRCRYGEADIIAKKNDVIILVEVKTKITFEQGDPEEMVNYFKQKKLRLIARHLEQEYPKHDILIDVIAIDLSAKNPKINHIQNAVE